MPPTRTSPSLRPARLRTRWLAACLAGIALLAGCADTHYYWQSVSGHLQLMHAARPVDDWLADPQTPPSLRERLVLAQRIRHFAASELALPDNPSYRRFADLQRRAVVWNVVAAPEFSLTLKTWCFPVLGCVGYRGYFSEADARKEAELLKAQGLEVSVYGVPAYSTLGWMNWAGGDPLLSTFIQYPEGELARIIFHELAHQVVYVPRTTPPSTSPSRRHGGAPGGYALVAKSGQCTGLGHAGGGGNYAVPSSEALTLATSAGTYADLRRKKP